MSRSSFKNFRPTFERLENREVFSGGPLGGLQPLDYQIGGGNPAPTEEVSLNLTGGTFEPKAPLAGSLAGVTLPDRLVYKVDPDHSGVSLTHDAEWANRMVIMPDPGVKPEFSGPRSEPTGVIATDMVDF